MNGKIICDNCVNNLHKIRYMDSWDSEGPIFNLCKYKKPCYLVLSSPLLSLNVASEKKHRNVLCGALNTAEMQ